jgi:hypothetical protein
MNLNLLINKSDLILTLKGINFILLLGARAPHKFKSIDQIYFKRLKTSNSNLTTICLIKIQI